MGLIRLALILFVAALLGACEERTTDAPVRTDSKRPAVAVADSFSYPVGPGKSLTEAKDTDDWYNALEFGEDNHLGEDWNKNTGGNTDCGEPVYAIGAGEIVYAADAGPGWGNVVIVTHTLPDGEKVQSLYGHLREIAKFNGEVKKRERIGTVGDANGRYPCHLHLELRTEHSRDWNRAGGGYSDDRSGWLDPSDFIDRRKEADN